METILLSSTHSSNSGSLTGLLSLHYINIRDTFKRKTNYFALFTVPAFKISVLARKFTKKNAYRINYA